MPAFRPETQALLFDLDGTLIDSDPDHLVAFQEVFAPHGIALDHALYTHRIMGASNAMIGDHFLAHLPAAERAAVFEAKEAAFRARMGDAATPTRGAAELLRHAAARGLPRAVVTNAPRANAEKALAALGLAELLPMLVIAGELARSKPDPLPYLTALERLGASAGKTVAFEDSLSGVQAAVAAGLAVIGITTGLSAERLLAAGAIFAVEDFRDPRIYELIAAKAAL